MTWEFFILLFILRVSPRAYGPLLRTIDYRPSNILEVEFVEEEEEGEEEEGEGEGEEEKEKRQKTRRRISC